MQSCGNSESYKDCLLRKVKGSLKNHGGSGKNTSTTKTSVCTVYDSFDECFLKKTKSVESARQSTYNLTARGACKGTQRLEKKTFIALLGAGPYVAPSIVDITLDEANQYNAQIALDKAGGNQQIAARTLGITPSSLRRKLKQWAAEPKPAQNYINPSRKFFENLSSWKITNFNPEIGEVCVDIATNSQTNHVSAKISSQI
jgi:DNA-binding protein Fis